MEEASMTTAANSRLSRSREVGELLEKVAGLNQNNGDPRLKQIVHRIVENVCELIEEFNITPSEFWSAMSYLTEVGKTNEIGLLVPGMGIEHFIDLRLDQEEREAGIESGTPRTIEGPLYIPNAPLSKGEARLDGDPDQGEVLFMEGQVNDLLGHPVPGAIIEGWHANSKGNYSFFDQSQTPFNLRRRIETTPDGKYRLRTILPRGYACPPDGPTQKLLNQLGRHGRRPAHIHFMVSAPGHRSLTTQINIDGDEYLHDDFAFATRDGLIPPLKRHNDSEEWLALGLTAPFITIDFNFTLQEGDPNAPNATVERERVQIV
jgi:catechol 1,2-dioxygenase